jgi:SPP1 family predicted phage head-tail adaptor
LIRPPSNPAGVRYKTATDYNLQVSFLTSGNVDNMGNIAAPSVLRTVWANVKAMQSVRGAAILKSDQILQKTNYLVTIRHRTDVNESMMLQIGADVFSVDSMADVDGRGVETTMIVSQTDQSI